MRWIQDAMGIVHLHERGSLQVNWLSESGEHLKIIDVRNITARADGTISRPSLFHRPIEVKTPVVTVCD